VQDLKITGQSPQRYDIPAKVDGSLKWAVDVRLPGMAHARNIKPPYAGAKLIGIDDRPCEDCRGSLKCEQGQLRRRSLRTRRGRRSTLPALKTNWEKPAVAPFPASEDLFNYIRGATPTSASAPIVVGNPDAAFAGAAKLIEAEYEIPFQGHTASDRPMRLPTRRTAR